MADLNNNSMLEDEPDTQHDHSTTNANPITTFNTTDANNSIFDVTDLNDSILEHEPDMQLDHPTTMSIYTITTLNTMDADNEGSGIQTQNTTNNTEQSNQNTTATSNDK